MRSISNTYPCRELDQQITEQREDHVDNGWGIEHNSDGENEWRDHDKDEGKWNDRSTHADGATVLYDLYMQLNVGDDSVLVSVLS